MMKNSMWKWAAGILASIVIMMMGYFYTNLEARVTRVEQKQELVESDIELGRTQVRLNRLRKNERCRLEFKDDWLTCEELMERQRRLREKIKGLER